MKRACELCKQTARIHCESDQASLCWDCDAKVHSANFLVARHSRSLLCRICQSPTPWSAAGAKLEPTLSDCRKCLNRTGCDERDGEVVEEAAGEEQEVVENQITPGSPPPPPPASESSFSGGEAVATRKRCRLGNDRLTHNDLNICTLPSDTEVASGADSIFTETATPPQKIRRTDPYESEATVCKSPTVEAVRRFHCDETDSGEKMTEYLSMSNSSSGGASAVVDLNLSLSLFSR